MLPTLNKRAAWAVTVVLNNWDQFEIKGGTQEMADTGVFNGRKVLEISVIVFLICLLGLVIIHFGETQIDTKANPNAVSAMSFLAAVLGLLAGGCIASFTAFSYRDVEPNEKRSMVFTAYLLIVGIFIMIFL